MKLAKTVALFVGLFLIMTADVSAQTTTTTAANPALGVMARFNGIGVGLVIIGAGLGIGKLTASGVEAMARQPEMAATIQTAIIISAALIEGVAFFAVIVLGFIISNS